jgi:hypothetical protein
MAVPALTTYSVGAGQPIHAGRWPGGRATGNVTLGDVAPSGGLEGTGAPLAAITNISLNDRDSINPRSNADLNPNAPSAAPWEASVGWGASALSAYCGALYCEDWGRYVMYGATGHSTNLEFCAWVAFDVTARQWEIVGAPPPTETSGYVVDTTPPASRFDHTWGEWQGNSTDWPVDFRRPGYNPPAGGHTRNSFVYIPGADAGNTAGKIVTAWEHTLNSTGSPIKGSHVYDCDTGLWSRTANLRPAAGSSLIGVAYHSDQNVVVGVNQISSAYIQFLDVLDMTTLTWTRRNSTNSFAFNYDSTNFTCGDLFIAVQNGAATSSFYAAPISTAKAGGSFAWTELTVSATSWPTKSSGATAGTWTCQWSRCPADGAWYAVDRNAGSSTLWKLTKPTGVDDSDTAGLLAGTWNITSQTLGGTGLADAAFDYCRLQWCQPLMAFLWVGDAHTSAVQAIRPIGV